MAEIIIENPKKSKKWLWILLVIVAIIVAAGVFYYFWKIAGNGSDVITDGGNSEVIIGGGLPEGFPSGLPIMAGTILQSQETKYESGIVQAISYSSTESLIKIYNDYSSYASSNGWLIVNKQENDNNYFIYATKDSASLNISISQELPEQSFVIVAYTKNQ
jgi:flagellar basal body-associated protein FliL